MANKVEAADRYNGIAVGPRMEYTWEVQSGIPVDGTNALLRDISPFTLRLMPPDALVASAGEGSDSDAVNLITAAAQGSNRNKRASELSTCLAKVSPVDAGVATLETFVAGGRFLSPSGSTIFPTLADATMAADIALQLQRILEVPPLTLLVNPREMSITYTNIQNYSTRTRYGFVFERWGEDLPSISFSGSSAAFIAGASAHGSGTARVPTGVQFASKRDSAAWQNLMSLLHFFKSGGYIYDTVGQSEAHLFIGALAIDYDQWTYVGNIESFDYSYDDSMPHRVDWSMEFRVSRMYDNAQSSYSVTPLSAPTTSPSDPKYSGSGSPRNPTALTARDVLELSEGARQAKGFLNGGGEDPEAFPYGTMPFDLLG